MSIIVSNFLIQSDNYNKNLELLQIEELVLFIYVLIIQSIFEIIDYLYLID